MTTPDPQPPDESVDLGAAEPTPFDPDHQALLEERDKLRHKVASVEHTRARATFFGLVIGAIIGILLLVFILQNLDSQRITLIFWEVNLPLGVSLLIAAIAGALIVALAGGVRMFQMGRALKKAKQ
ncbi:lipopolysaccharide assembly protein LapA domain-containing protein [Gordonia sp. CPCC 206044]|uniref:LapA family protein n=1 Tax=Gordonia sp. CPCC 206044 TaxID=3140793 RepID=UPI003AF344FD